VHRTINHLVQLQELKLAREQEAFMGGGRLEQLDEAIRHLTEQLPPNVKTAFQKLQKKDTVAIVPISAGVCSTCGMKLPISLVQAVRVEAEIHPCPNCSRILYYTDAPPRSVARKQRRTEPRRVGMDRFSAAELMIPRLEATDRDSALRELADKMEKEGFVEQAEKLVEEALKREAIIGTAVDHGLAFPHVRGVEGGGLTLALGISTKGISFNPAEKNLTHVIFFMVIPTAATAFYLKLLAGLAETFMPNEARHSLLSEEDPVKLWKLLKKLTRRTIV
jgi:mannitol/fructose-specific phosphotransferase system IIA component (Ntr-type)